MSTIIEMAKVLSKLAVSFINISADDIDAGIQEALRRLGEYASADRSYVFTFSAGQTQMSNIYEWVAPGITSEMDELQNLAVAAFPWFSEKIIKGDTVYVPKVRNLPEEAHAEKEEWTREHIKSLICLPMVNGREVIGFIGFDSVTKDARWQADILALLEISGSMIANVLARKKSEQAQKTRVEELEILNSVALALTDANSVDDLIVNAVKIMSAYLGSDNFGVALVDEDANLMRSVLMSYGGQLKRETFPYGKGIVGRVVKTGKIARVDDVDTDPDYLQVNEVTRSELSVPIKFGSDVVGVVNVESKKLAAFSQRDENLIEIFARQLGLAIEKLKLFEQVQELAIQDTLTGLFNRRHFFDLAEVEFDKSVRYSLPLSVIMVDIDGFKDVNDVYGHGLGDQMLVAIGDVMRQGLRSSDIAGRYGGDEFVVLMPGSDLNAAKRVAKRLEDLTKELTAKGTRGTVSVTLSQGIAVFDGDTSSLEQLLDHADQALLMAKRKKPSQILVWGEDVTEEDLKGNHRP